LSKNRNILNINKLQLKAVARNKRKSKENSIPKWDAIPEYKDSPPLTEEEQEIIDSICNNNVFYSPRKRITTKFNDELQRWQALGFQSENDHLHGRTNSDDYYLYFVSKKISGKDTKDTVTFCFTGATRPDGSHPGYLIQTS